MATNFPTSLDTLTNPSATDTLDSPPHDEQHADANDAIEALQAKVGVDSSAVTSSLDYRVTTLEGAGAGMETSATPPASPSDGDMWYDTDDGRTYVYYDDGTSQQWVEFGAPAVQHGKILQVVSTTKTDTFSASIAAGSSSAVTGLTVDIAPSSTSNKVLIQVMLSGSTPVADRGGVILTRGGSAISGAIADAAGSRGQVTGGLSDREYDPNTSTFVYLDSPASTSTLTYGVSLFSTYTGNKYVNRGQDDSDLSQRFRAVSTITVMEVSA